jgi:cyclic pyranopterin phosphate synthase
LSTIAGTIDYASSLSRHDTAISAAQQRLRMLRLSITSKCNFRCCYCIPPEGVPKVAHTELVSLERLAELVSWLADETGINRVRLTGGEPLVRRGVVDLVTRLSTISQIREVTLTTNGSLLAGMAENLKAAGLKRVNISLDSLDPDRFAKITRGGELRKTLEGIDAAIAAGLSPVKLNAVLQRSTWKQDVPQLLDFAADKGLEIRFIELMRTGTGREWCDSEFISAREVCEGTHIESSSRATVPNSSAQQTVIAWRGEPLMVGWITPRSHPFCDKCERLRMDAQGKLRRCLMDPTTLDLHSILANEGDFVAQNEFREFLAGKRPPLAMDNIIPMSQVGG